MADNAFDHSQMVMLYVTAPDMECARDLAARAVRGKLAACANMLPQMTAIYEWNGEIEESAEVVLLLKTARDKAEKLAAFVTENHPYDVPCILEVPLGRGNQGYVSWLKDQLRQGLDGYR